MTAKDWEDRGGYMYGTTHIRGTGAHEGHTLDVWFKNENHVSWLDGEPWVCSPDLVTLAYRDGEGTTNTLIDEGDEVSSLYVLARGTVVVERDGQPLNVASTLLGDRVQINSLFLAKGR